VQVRPVTEIVSIHMWHMVYQKSPRRLSARFRRMFDGRSALDLSAFDAYVNLATETDDRPGDPL
jgi:hypothetical protein